MINPGEIEATPRDQKVMRLLVQGCRNKEIASALNISPRTLKQHLPHFSYAGHQGRPGGVKLAHCAMFINEQASMQPCDRLTTAWQGLTQSGHCLSTENERAGGGELPADGIRQTGCVGSAGVGALRGQPRWSKLAY